MPSCGRIWVSTAATSSSGAAGAFCASPTPAVAPDSAARAILAPPAEKMNAFGIAKALGRACREGRGWRTNCPAHGGFSLNISDGRDGKLLVHCWGGCDPLDVLENLRN